MKILWTLPLLVACGGETSADAGADAALEAEASVDYGSCGQPAHDCLCACADGGDCTSCYSTYPACLTCVDDAVTTCCPVEYPAWKQCIADSQKPTDGGPAPCAPSDVACQNARCQSEAAALQTCLGTSACKTARIQCTGTCP